MDRFLCKPCSFYEMALFVKLTWQPLLPPSTQERHCSHHEHYRNGIARVHYGP